MAHTWACSGQETYELCLNFNFKGLSIEHIKVLSRDGREEEGLRVDKLTTHGF